MLSEWGDFRTNSGWVLGSPFIALAARIRTVPVPVWVKQAINLDDRGGDRGRAAAAIDLEGRLGRQEPGCLVRLVGSRAIRQRDWNRPLWSPRPAPAGRQALPEERWRPGTDQIPPGALLDRNHGTVSGVGAGDRDRGQRLAGTLRLADTVPKLPRSLISSQGRAVRSTMQRFTRGHCGECTAAFEAVSFGLTRGSIECPI